MENCLPASAPDWEARSQEMYDKAKTALHEGFVTPLQSEDADIWIEAYQCAYDDIVDRLEKLGFTHDEIGLLLDLKTWRDKQ